jgi:hypothetical protein
MKILNRIMCVIGYCASVVVLIWYVSVHVNYAGYAYAKMVRERSSHGKLSNIEPDLSGAILSFSSSLENGDWTSVYNYMNKVFKNDYTYEYFMMKLSESEPIWQMKKWSVVDVEYFNDNLSRVIIKFERAYDEKYSVFWWVKEDNNWSCVISFPFKLEFSARCLYTTLSEFIPSELQE